VEVEPPAKYDPAWARDGIAEKPADRTGQRQWWAQQILGLVPPTHWSTAWKLSPAECVAAVTGDYRKLLLAAWHDAAVRHPDAGWAAPLIAPPAAAGADPDRVDPTLLAGLPPADQEAILVDVLGRSDLKHEALFHLVARTTFPLGPRGTEAVIAVAERRAAAAKKSGYDYELTYVLPELALRLPPAAHEDLARRWVGPYWESNRRALDGCLQTLQLRRDIQREFAT
ncbi:MAG: hypothetical protein JWO31_511, partial [Phycisphaerales bacterium]|nr:hypothetical protein [Phycisphaerales bacterium]